MPPISNDGKGQRLASFTYVLAFPRRELLLAALLLFFCSGFRGDGEPEPAVNADGQVSRKAHDAHDGRAGAHTVCPKPTRSGLMVAQCSHHEMVFADREFQERFEDTFQVPYEIEHLRTLLIPDSFAHPGGTTAVPTTRSAVADGARWSTLAGAASAPPSSET